MIDHGRRTVTFSRSDPAIPPVCAVCLEESSEIIAIHGAGHRMTDLLLALFLTSAREANFTVVVCTECVRRERRRTLMGYVFGALGIVASGLLMCLTPVESPWTLVGLAFLVLSPIAASAWVAVGKKIPVVWNFDDATMEILFRNTRYLTVYEDWLRDRQRSTG